MLQLLGRALAAPLQWPWVIPGIESLAVIVAAYLINRFLIKRFLTRFAERAKIPKHYAAPIQKFISLIVWIIVIIAILGIWGLRGALYSILAGAGFLGIVIGFGAKDIIANLFGGIILFIERPLKIGDLVEIDDLIGTVKEISIRSTRIYTLEGINVTVPNSRLVTDIVKNWSIPTPEYRVTLPVGVDYDTDLEKAIEICFKVIARFDEISKKPKPSVIFKGFGSSSLDLNVCFWIDVKKINFRKIKSKVGRALKKEFDKQGISIPFPHREILTHK